MRTLSPPAFSPQLQALLLVLLVFIAYAPAMNAGFIWDDEVFFSRNPIMKDPAGLKKIWLSTELPDYFPLTSSSLWLEYRLWGERPAGYHLTNIILHAISSVLLWLLLKQLGLRAAWVAAALFALHPVNVEAVAWITQRKSTLPMVFYLGAFLTFIRFEKTSRAGMYLLTLLLFLLGLLAKTSIVMLPAILLALIWWKKGKLTRRDIFRSIPFFILSLALGLLTVWFQTYRAIGDTVVRTDGFLSRLAGAGWCLWFYLYKAIAPFRLSFIYPRWELQPASVLHWLPLTFWAALFLILVWKRNQWGRSPVFVMFAYSATLLPVLGFINIYFMRYSLVADHYQYHALPILTAFAAAGFHRLLKKPAPVFKLAAAGLVLMLFGLLTYQRSMVFQNSIALWRDTLRKNPDTFVGHEDLAFHLSLRGQFDEAVEHYERSIELNPENNVGRYNLAKTLIKMGRNEQAFALFDEILKRDPARADVYNEIGLILALQRDTSEARSFFEKALEVNPSFSSAMLNIGILEARLGNRKGAKELFMKVVELDQYDSQAHYNLGVAFAHEGNFEKALEHVRLALRYDPEYPEAQAMLKQLLADFGKTAD